MTYATEHLMDLVRPAHATTAPDELRRLLGDGHDLYHEGLAEMRIALAQQHRHLPDSTVYDQCRQAEIPLPDGASRDEALGLLAFSHWQHTPTALAYASIAEHAARHGLSLIPE